MGVNKFWGACPLIQSGRGERGGAVTSQTTLLQKKGTALGIQGSLAFSVNLLISGPDPLNSFHSSHLTLR